MGRMMDTNEYARLTAITMHAALMTALKSRYPDLPTRELDYLALNVIDRLARLRGYSVRRDGDK